jgi:pimeloyl-ACP methyl ester carboxylesterase
VARDFRAFTDATGADRLALAAHAEAVHHEPIPLERISAPTLLLIGDADALASGAPVLVDAIRGASLEVYEGDHLGVVANPGFAEAIVRFLS